MCTRALKILCKVRNYRTGSITVRGLYFFYTQVLADLIRERILIGPAKIGVFAASIFYIQVKGADCNRERYFIWERTVMEPVRYIYVGTLFRNKRFALNEMFQQNASKFAIFYV